MFKRNLTIAFYPQSDGQTERQNQTVEAYLRVYINHLQDNWAQWLPLAKFSYKNSQHASTQCSTFFALTGQHPRVEETIGKIPEDKGPDCYGLSSSEGTEGFVRIKDFRIGT